MHNRCTAPARFRWRRASQALRYAIPVFVTCMLIATSVPAFAQEVYGSIVGTVRDQRGDVVQGATVELVSDQRTLTATTDSEGGYQFLNVLPGTYTVTVTASGFGAKRREGVPVELGRNLQVDFQVEAGITETTVVTASDEPIVDITSTKTATNITKSEFEVIPKTLNYASVIAVAPGTRQEAKGTGFSVDGASGAENVFILDGVEVTRVQNGQLDQSKNVPFDFVQEVQVKSAGFEAEFGGATGGVINVVTRSGANDWHGEFRAEFQFDELRAEDNPTLRLNPLNSTQFEYFRNPLGKDDTSLFAPVFSLSGPLVKDKLWFYASYAPQFDRRTRRLDFIDAGQNVLTSRDIDYEINSHYQFARLDWAPHEKVQANVSFINSPIRTQGPFGGPLNNSNPYIPLFFQTGTSQLYNYQQFDLLGGYTPSWQLAGAVTYNPSDNWVLSFRGGQTYLNDKGGNYNIPFGNSGPAQLSINIPCTPDSDLLNGADCPAGTSLTGSITPYDPFVAIFDITRRTNLNFDATYVTRFLGQQHILKGGYQINHISNKVNSGRQGGLAELYFGASYDEDDDRGDLGFYRIRDFRTVGDVSSRNQAIFLQDAWSIHPRVTLNLGVRFENEFLPAFPLNLEGHPDIDPELAANATEEPISFGWGDKIAPRIGVAWDVFGDSRLKVYGSFGFFYDTMKYELPRGSFGGDIFLLTYYTLDDIDLNSINLANPPGEYLDGPFDLRFPSNIVIPGERPTIDPDLLATRSREYTVGADYGFTTNLVAGVRLTRKELDRTIEDVGGVDANGNEIFTIGNPGFGATVDFFDPPTPEAVREYTGLEFRVDKRFANNWYANISYIYSKLYGNYSGLASSDEVDVNGVGRSSPNVNRYFDLPELVYNAYGQQVLGRLATDRPHTLKAYASYRFNYWGQSTDVGASQLAFSGTPLSSRIHYTVEGAGADLYPEGRGNLGRTEAFTQTDLVVTHRWTINERITFKATVNVLNLWDERNVTNVFEFITRAGQPVRYENSQDFLNSNGDYIQRINDTYGAIGFDPRYLQPRNFQAPRLMRFGFGIEF
jgi:hypothetical protein